MAVKAVDMTHAIRDLFGSGRGRAFSKFTWYDIRSVQYLGEAFNDVTNHDTLMY